MFHLIDDPKSQLELSKLHAKLTNAKVAAQAVFYIALAAAVLIFAFKI